MRIIWWCKCLCLNTFAHMGIVGKVTKMNGSCCNRTLWGGACGVLRSISLLPLLPLHDLFPCQYDRWTLLCHNNISPRASLSPASTSSTSTITNMASMGADPSTIIVLWSTAIITQMPFVSTIVRFPIVSYGVGWSNRSVTTDHRNLISSWTMAEIASSKVGRLSWWRKNSPSTLKFIVQSFEELGHSPVLCPFLDSLSIIGSLHLKWGIVI